jgi:hypothetical protein
MKTMFFEKFNYCLRMSIVSLVLCLFTYGYAADNTGELFAHDYSNRCSILNPISLGNFNTQAEGWSALSGCKAFVSDGTDLSSKAQEGAKCIEVTATNLSADKWKGIVKEFSTPLDLSAQSLLSFGIITTSARPGRKEYARLVLYDGTDSVEYRSEFIPSLWRTIAFDISGCKFLKSITKIEISMMNNSSSNWASCSFLIDDIKVGAPLDLMFSVKGCSTAFTPVNGTITESNDAISFNFNSNASITTTELGGSFHSMYNPPIDKYNTFFVVLANKSSLKRARLYYTTSSITSFAEEASKEFEILPNSGLTAYYINISDCAKCGGNLTGLRIVPVGDGTGTWDIDRISFLREDPIEPYAGKITQCTADKEYVTIKGTVSSQYTSSYTTIAIYEAPMFVIDGKLDASQLGSLTKLYEGPISSEFNIASIENKRYKGRMTLLSSRLLAVVKDANGNAVKIAPYFYITNWRDFEENPYAFSLPDKKFNVLDYGAKGDGFTDDTEAINKAVTACSAAGGGQVFIPGDVLAPTDSVYGRRYVATNIILKDNVDLHLDHGAVIWQSADRRDYSYDVYYGHDMDIPGIPWTHCMFVNLPLIQGMRANNIKITGPGTLLLYDRYTSNPDWSHYANVCADRIHICPIGMFKCNKVEISDIDIRRSPNYHTSFSYCTNMFLGDIKMYEPGCVSGDGLSFSHGTHHVKVVRAILNSNDDGLVLSSSYKDPRNTVSPWRPANDDEDNSTRDIVCVHSCLNSAVGGGKAVSIVPWGSTNPDPEKSEIDSVIVSDCVLRGGYSVGTWPDNPFDGKDFTNTETNDFSPVKNFNIHHNQYVNACDLLCVTPTNFIGDTGIHSSSKFMNGDFSKGHTYWTMSGEAGVEDGYGYARNGGKLFEGLYLNKSKFALKVQVRGNGRLFVIKSADTTVVYSEKVSSAEWSDVSATLDITAPSDYQIGIDGDNINIRSCNIDVIRTPNKNGTMLIEAEDYDKGGREVAYHNYYGKNTSSYRDDSQGAYLDTQSYYSNKWGISNMGDGWDTYGLKQYIDSTSNLITKDMAADSWGSWYKYTFTVEKDCDVDISVLAGCHWGSYGIISAYGAHNSYDKSKADGGYKVQGMNEDWVKRYTGAFVMSLDGVDMKGNQINRPIWAQDGVETHFLAVAQDESKWKSTLIDGVNNDTIWVYPNPDNPNTWTPYYHKTPDYKGIHLTAGEHTIVMKSLSSQWVFDAIKVQDENVSEPSQGAYGDGVFINGEETAIVEAENYDYGGMDKAFHTHHALTQSDYRTDSKGADIDSEIGSSFSNSRAIADMGDNLTAYTLGKYVDSTSNEITADDAVENFGRWYNYTINAVSDCKVDITISSGMNFDNQANIILGSSGWNKPRSNGGYTVDGLQEDWTKRYCGAFLLKLDGVTLKGSQLSRPVALDDTTSHIVKKIKNKDLWTSTLVNGQANDTVWVWCNADSPYTNVAYYQDEPQFTSISLTSGEHVLTFQSLCGKWTFDAIRFDPAANTGIYMIQASKLLVYPNPTNSVINVKGAEGKYQIISLSSGLVMKEESNEQVDVSDFAPGVYAVRCGFKVARFIKR